MAVLDFPANPVLNQEYNFPPFRYRWDGEKWRTIGTGANPVQTQIAEHRVEKDAHAIETITNLREELSALGGTPVLSVVWVQRRDAMWPGYVAADGQTLSRADYADAWAAIEAGKVPVTSDTAWLAAASNRGGFSTGDGSTTFRLPDYNGKFAGSMGAVFLRGDGVNSAGTNGVIQGDAIRNITASFGGSNATPFHSADPRHTDGAMTTVDVPTSFRASFENAGAGGAVLFDASTVVPTAADNHPINVTGCWAVKLVGAAQNSGQIDALTLVSQVADLQSKLARYEDKHYFFSQYFEPITIGTNSGVLPVFKYVQKVKGIVPHKNNDGVQVKKDGTYKISYGYTLESQAYSQQTVLNLYLAGKDTGDALAYYYLPRNDTGIVVITMCTWSGVYDLKAGDDIWLRVGTVNSTQAKLFRTGYFQVEEVVS